MKRKYIAPSIVCVIFVAISLAFSVWMLHLYFYESIRFALILIYAGIYVIVAICVIAAYISRVKEIRGGEENDLGNY